MKYPLLNLRGFKVVRAIFVVDDMAGEHMVQGSVEGYETLMRPLSRLMGEEPGPDLPDNVAYGEVADTAPRQNNEALVAANAVASAYRAATRALEEEVLAFVYVQSPRFFESLIIDLLLAMGYASRRRDLAAQLGQSHDGGVDGVVRLDPLGLDVILIQAKRLKPNATVSAAQVRDFIGTLATRRANKGVFVTTGSFSGFARSTIDQAPHCIKLVDGRQLSKLMVRHNLGVKPLQSFIFKRLDPAYFSAGQQA